MRKKIVIGIVVVFTFFLGFASSYLLIRFYPLQTEEVKKVINEYKVEETSAFDAIDKIYDAVVVVETFRGNTQIASGTGFVYKKDSSKGYIITNNHVTSGSNKVEVIMTNGDRVTATVLGSDEVGDITVLSIPANKVIEVAQIGSTENVRVGSTVFAIGAPMGSEYSGTTTKGCISAKNRMITYTLGTGTTETLMRVIQTDAAINPGNSGGPLIDLAGDVIGITSSKLVEEQVEGIGFAIPIEDAMKYMDELESGKPIKRPVLGVQLLDTDEDYALFYNDIRISDDIKSGAVISAIIDNSSAAVAGLKKGDVIVKIGDTKIKNKAELRYQLYKYSVGDKLKITYIRDDKTEEAEVTLKGSTE